MSSFGTGSGGTALWGLNPNGLINGYYLGFKSSLRPVISVYANTLSSGEGTSLIPYVIETK